MGIPLVVAAVAIGFVAAALAEIGSASGSYRRTVDRGFAALAASVAVQSEVTGTSLGTLLTTAPTLERPVLFAELDHLAAAAASEQDSLDAAAAPSPDAGAGAGCLSALSGRDTATASVRRALEGLLGGTTGTSPLDPGVATSELESAAATLFTADTEWASCRRRLGTTPGRPHLAASRWMARPNAWAPGALATLVGSVAGSSSLAAHPALEITTLATDPPLLPGPANSQLAPTHQVTVHVVISDAGNVDEPTVVVTVTLTGGPSLEALSARVGLRAGGATTVVLGPLQISPGGSYSLQVSAAPPSGAGGAVTTSGLQVDSLPPTTTTTTVPRRRR